jgi:predicted nucleotidyltransferase
MRRLAEAERDHDIRILYAVESGSRAWGFESPNSDYDVRFIYARKQEWYLSVEPGRDVVEYPIVDDIDISGWDVRKALHLLKKSNPSLVEWLHSPEVYLCDKKLAPALRKLLVHNYSSIKGIHHYKSMAKTNYRAYLSSDLVPLKKYFYVLRPLLAARWIETYNSVAPIEFERLLSMLTKEPDLKIEILTLVERKRLAKEKQYIPRVKRVNEFIEHELARLEKISLPKVSDYCSKSLDSLFRLALEFQN